MDTTAPQFSLLYTPIRKLGQGGFGSVYLCQRISDLAKCVVKVVPECNIKRTTYCPDREIDLPDEIMLWEPLSHSNIVPLKDVYFEKETWIMVMDYCPGFVDLFDYVAEHGAMSSGDAANIIKQVIETCYYLTAQGIDHRDIKDENILYNPETKQIKLIDFGSASLLSESPYRYRRGTDVYIPPEYHNYKSYHALPAAVWAIGCLSYALLNGKCPFNTVSHVQEYTTLTWRKPTVGVLARHFTELCLKAAEKERMEFRHFFLHPWFLKHSI